MSPHLKGVVKAHRIALDPTDRQASLMLEHAGWARVAANWARGRFQLAWFGETDERNADEWSAHVEASPDGGAWLSDMDLRKDFNAVKADLFAWSGGLSQNVAKNAIIHRGRGLEAWGAACKARKHGQPHRKVGFPPVRKRYRKLAFTPSNGRNSIQVDGRQVRLPRIGWVRMREALRFDGDILSITVSRTAGRWFASFTVDTGEPAPAPRPGPDVGIDMGVKTLAVLWDGGEKTEIANPKALAALRATQQAISRSVKVNGRPCTRNRRRLYEKLARQHAQVVRIRSDHHHKATTQIAKRGGSVTVETLNVDGMKRNRRLARAISDAGMAEFVRQLEYKCHWYGTEFRRVDRWYPSSRTCSDCGAVKPSLLLSERTDRCHRCGFECDRDENAARNLQAFGRPGRPSADAETRKTDCGSHGRRSIHQTAHHAIPLDIT